MEKRYDVWVEITANKEWILDAVKFEETMKKCRAVGMTGIILSVKDTTGFSLYPSQIAPHYSKYDKTFLPAYDYVKQCFSIIKNLGMKCYAAFDTFAAGNGKNHQDVYTIEVDDVEDGYRLKYYGKNEFADRFMNKNGSLRKTPLKKKRAISKLEFFIPEYEYRRLKKMKDPIETLERPVEHMTVYRNDGSSVTLTAENGRVSIVDSREKNVRHIIEADYFVSKIL